MNNNWIVKITHDLGYKLDRDIYIYRKLYDGKIEYMTDGLVSTIREEGEAMKPTLSLPPETLQLFADALAEMNIKPQEGFVEGKLLATEKHLEDMRKIVFETPKSKHK